MAPKKTCLSFLADGVTLCGKDAKFPEDNPIVCGNHKYKIVDGAFDQSATNARLPFILPQDLAPTSLLGIRAVVQFLERHASSDSAFI